MHVNYSAPHSHQFCRTVLRMQAFDACQQNCAGSRVNYSAPHSQNRLSEASFLLMWLLRRINSAAQSYECEHSTPVSRIALL